MDKEGRQQLNESSKVAEDTRGCEERKRMALMLHQWQRV